MVDVSRWAGLRDQRDSCRKTDHIRIDMHRAILTAITTAIDASIADRVDTVVIDATYSAVHEASRIALGLLWSNRTS